MTLSPSSSLTYCQGFSANDCRALSVRLTINICIITEKASKYFLAEILKMLCFIIEMNNKIIIVTVIFQYAIKIQKYLARASHWRAVKELELLFSEL